MGSRVLCRFHFRQLLRKNCLLTNHSALVIHLQRYSSNTWTLSYSPLFQTSMHHSRSLNKLCPSHAAPPVFSFHFHYPNVNYQPSLLYSVRPPLNSNKPANASGQTGDHITHCSPVGASTSASSSLHLEDLEGIHRELRLAILDHDDDDGDCHRNARPTRGEMEIVTQQVKDILRGVYNGNRAKLAEAITLVESKHPVKHKQAQWILTKMLSRRNKQKQLGTLKSTFRIGFSGPPGAGKSTLIETFGQMLTSLNYKLAVLAVDPSSSRTGGSIMGDKTRMPRLARDLNAYIRPSPAGGTLGGVTRSTNEVITLCEGAGFDIILVETVGVGQSETAVCDMVDMFVLIIPPAAGDELQGMKRGIVELSDLVVVNKADGDLLPAARRIKAEYVSALKLMKGKTSEWRPQVVEVSALHKKNIDKTWKLIQDYFETMKNCGVFYNRRETQQRLWLWNHINWELRERFRSHPGMEVAIAAMEGRVMAGSMAPGTAADILLDRFVKII